MEVLAAQDVDAWTDELVVDVEFGNAPAEPDHKRARADAENTEALKIESGSGPVGAALLGPPSRGANLKEEDRVATGGGHSAADKSSEFQVAEPNNHSTGGPEEESGSGGGDGDEDSEEEDIAKDSPRSGGGSEDGAAQPKVPTNRRKQGSAGGDFTAKFGGIRSNGKRAVVFEKGDVLCVVGAMMHEFQPCLAKDGGIWPFCLGKQDISELQGGH